MIDDLKALQGALALEEKAKEGARTWLTSESLSLPPGVADTLQFAFKFHKLCFKHAALDYPYIETGLTIRFEGEDIGHYALFSALDGTPLDDEWVRNSEDLEGNT